MGLSMNPTRFKKKKYDIAWDKIARKYQRENDNECSFWG